ncbi:MAG: DMT family transporter [Opitutaceae bacterium]|nr:DMT family transporter [Opitutaceae bacterium]
MSTASDSIRHRAFAMLILANFFWGLSFPLIKAQGQLHQLIDPSAPDLLVTLYTIAPRFLVASLILFAWRPSVIRDTTAKEWRQGLWLGAFAAAGMALQNEGLRTTHASTSAFLTQLYAILIPLWWAAVRRTNPGWRIWMAVGLVMVGGAILSRFNPLTLDLGRGEAMTLLCSFFFMGQILTLERPCFTGNDPLRVTFAMFVVEGVLFWSASAWSSGGLTHLLLPWYSLPWVAHTVGLAVFCTLAAFILMNTWQPRITSTEAGLIYCIEPLFGALMALFLPGLISRWTGISYENETLTWTLLAGGALITWANVLVQRAPVASAKRVDDN